MLYIIMLFIVLKYFKYDDYKNVKCNFLSKMLFCTDFELCKKKPIPNSIILFKKNSFKI